MNGSKPDFVQMSNDSMIIIKAFCGPTHTQQILQEGHGKWETAVLLQCLHSEEN